ncbi:hypothetical protein Taro_034938 [Colocasia esculenta]|uniref:Uncharacterized protein n=1 Tax=Colocasia esculenta TaxID=4460 RepID=A0A843VXQ0_COLES|nr:hypothetical protein [Colocasia esculenta]
MTVPEAYSEAVASGVDTVCILPVVSTQSACVSTQSASGVDTVHMCVDTSSLSQKPVLQQLPVVSTQSACVSTHFD